MSDLHSEAAEAVEGARLEESNSDASSLLKGHLGWQIFWLALPVLAEQFLNYTVGLTDAFLSGRISKEATSAVGVGAYVNWLVEILFAVVGTGTGALVARHWGAGERDPANRIAKCSITLAAILGVISTLGMYAIAPAFSELLGLKSDMAAIATRFLRISCLGYVFSSVSLIGSAALRGAGMMRIPMYVLGLVSVLNILFSTSLVFGLGPFPNWGIDQPLVTSMGIDGIATGTVMARAFGAALMLVVMASGISDLRALPSLVALQDFGTMRRILKIGAPAATDGLLMWAGHMVFVRIIAGIGNAEQMNAALAAHIVFIEVEAVTYMPAWAWGTAAATLAGQSLGANLPDRARQGVHRAALQSVCWASLVALIFFFWSPLIYSQMHTDPLVGELGAPALRALCLMEIPLALAITYTVAVRGAGDTVAPLLINATCVFGVRLTVGYACTQWWDGGLFGAWLGMATDVTVRSIAIMAYFHSGRWMKTKL